MYSRLMAMYFHNCRAWLPLLRGKTIASPVVVVACSNDCHRSLLMLLTISKAGSIESFHQRLAHEHATTSASSSLLACRKLDTRHY
jgi:hypothetical protein